MNCKLVLYFMLPCNGSKIHIKKEVELGQAINNNDVSYLTALNF